MRVNIFLRYSDTDVQFVDRLAGELPGSGVQVWRDVKAIYYPPHVFSIFPKSIKVVHGAVAGADGEGVFNRFSYEALRKSYGFLQLEPLRQMGGDGRGEGAAGSVGVAGLDARRGEFLKLPTII